jgi:ankyrin repeat protein
MFNIACQEGHIDIMKYLISISEKYTDKKIDIHYNKNIAFFMACKNKHFIVVKYLIEMAEEYSGQKIDIFCAYHVSTTCIAASIVAGSVEIIKYIFMIAKTYYNCPFDIHLQNDIYFSLACYSGHVNVVKYLMEIAESYSGTKINNIMTGLWYGYKYNHLPILKYLTKTCVKYYDKMISFVGSYNFDKYINNITTFTQYDKYFYSIGIYNKSNHRELIIL